VTLTQLEHLAVALAAASLLLVLASGGIVVVRLRRRWRSRHSMLRKMVGRPLTRVPVSGLSERLISTVASPAWWHVQRDRQAMWRSVTAARRAVSVAARADAPVGDLPVLVRQLRQAATGVDAALRASGGERRVTRAVTADRIRIEDAANDIRAAALASLAAMRVDVQPVVSAISVEVAALAAGIQAARSAGL
jgi:hypothetical protein